MKRCDACGNFVPEENYRALDATEGRCLTCSASGVPYGQYLREPGPHHIVQSEVYGHHQGTAKFTVGTSTNGFLNKNSLRSVEVKVEFDPQTEEWSAKVVRSWKGKLRPD